MNNENFFFITLFYLCAERSGKTIAELEAKIVDTIIRNEEI